jgi:hypothetical protein
MRNPAEAVSPPRTERKAMRALDTAQIAILLEHFRSTRLFIPVLLAVMCGLRQGKLWLLNRCLTDFRP